MVKQVLKDLGFKGIGVEDTIKESVLVERLGSSLYDLSYDYFTGKSHIVFYLIMDDKTNSLITIGVDDGIVFEVVFREVNLDEYI